MEPISAMAATAVRSAGWAITPWLGSLCGLSAAVAWQQGWESPSDSVIQLIHLLGWTDGASQIELGIEWFTSTQRSGAMTIAALCLLGASFLSVALLESVQDAQEQAMQSLHPDDPEKRKGRRSAYSAYSAARIMKAGSIFWISVALLFELNANVGLAVLAGLSSMLVLIALNWLRLQDAGEHGAGSSKSDVRHVVLFGLMGWLLAAGTALIFAPLRLIGFVMQPIGFNSNKQTSPEAK